MCGIAGVFSLEPVEVAVVERMLAAISYRGPDHREAQQYLSPDGSCLTVGQARLAIVDLSPEANQPFESPEGRTCLTFNGEFYNFQELKQRLPHYNFQTRSDTEVALAALDHWGVNGLNELWGMFAGAWFQVSQGKLVLFRDRPGKKPLYLYQDGKRLWFASEPKAILAVLDHLPPPDTNALAHYFYLGYIPSQLCAFKGMFKLPAGHVLEIDSRFQPRIAAWYQDQIEPTPPEQDLEEIFTDAVARRMIADVPLAAFLSGGLDSSLVVAAMARISNQPVNTFSVRFGGAQVLDESKYARLVAAHYKTHHTEIMLDVNKLLEAVPRVLDHFDEPFGDASAVPMLVVSEEARKQFTVALSGDGADEIFAGYRKYLGPYYLARLGPYALRRFLWRPLSGLLPTGRTSNLLETGRRIRRLLLGDAPSAGRRHVNWLYMSPIDRHDLAGPSLVGWTGIESDLAKMLPEKADLNDCLRFDQKLVLQDDMFVKVDRMSMMASLEVRSPFVDHRLIQLANGLDPVRKLDGTKRKKVLIERLGHMLPTEILSRPKTGFEMPTGAWLRGEMRGLARERLFYYADTSEWVNRKGLEEVWNIHQSGKLDCTETLWHHLVFASWLKRIYQ